MKLRIESRISRLLAGAALFLLTPLSAFAQDAAAGGHDHGDKSFMDILIEGGWVMIPLALFSIAMVWLIIDCVMRTNLKRMMPEMEVEKARNFFRSGDYVGAYQAAAEVPCSLNNVMRAGLINVGEGRSSTEEGILSESIHESMKISTRISYLSVIGVCTPMVGLVGTVTGMIKAFGALGKGNVAQNTGMLSAAIGEVLVATASGLVVAIPAFMAFYFLKNRLNGAMKEVESEVGHLFRKFPYHLAEGVHIGDQELYANTPNWVEGAGDAAPVHG